MRARSAAEPRLGAETRVADLTLVLRGADTRVLPRDQEPEEGRLKLPLRKFVAPALREMSERMAPLRVLSTRDREVLPR